jgi:hypothetical protein
MIYYNHKARAKEINMTKAETKLFGLMNKATETGFVCLPRYAKVIEDAEKAMLISGKDRNGIVYVVIFLKGGKLDFFESRSEEEAETKMLIVA